MFAAEIMKQTKAIIKNINPSVISILLSHHPSDTHDSYADEPLRM